MAERDPDILLRVWKAERRNELESDTTALIDALIEQKAELHTVLGDVIDALKRTPRGASSLDIMVERCAAAEDVIQRQIDFVMAREEALGRWQSYTPVDEYEPSPEDALMQRIEREEYLEER